MNLKGKVIKVGDIQVVSDKFSKRELWLEVPDGEYPQTLCIEFVNGKIGLLDSLSVGSEADVSINLRGRVHKDKCYNTIQGWKIDVTGQAAQPEILPTNLTDPKDDLPF